MQTQAPSVGKILIAVGFALSCFGLLLFIYVSFGGPTPFRAKQYEFTADFPEAVTLAKQSDVRIGGVSVGKVTKLALPDKGNATEVTMQLQPKFAPIPSDTRAILRQKTLLGETYVELSGGSANAPKLADGGHLARAQTQDSTQLDEILAAFDPKTRKAFRVWIQNSAQAVNGRGQDLNDALGNLGPFATDANHILAILNHQQHSLQGLVRDTGTVFDSLSARDDELAGAIRGSNETFGALASRDRALAEVIHIFPTFNQQTRLTLNRLATFAHNTEPLVRDLKPVADDLSPTLIKVKHLSPHLKGLFIHLKPLLRVSETGLPALSKTLRELRPVLAALDPFLANFNPIIRYTNAYKTNVGDFLSNPPAALAGTLAPEGSDPNTHHLLRQIGYLSSESLSIYPNRPATNRGNGYLQPLAITGFDAASGGIFPNWDCNNTGSGEIPLNAATVGNAPCFVAGNFPPEFGGKHAPQVFADP